MRLPFWATLCTLAGVVVLCALGTWQLHRLEWKQDVLAAIDKEYETDSLTRSLVVADMSSKVLRFKRGYLVGSYQNDKEILLQSRTYKGVPGYHVLVPLILTEDRGSILVNRGWIPIESDRKPDFQMARTDKSVKIGGILRSAPEDNAFVPYNQPEKDMWYRVDITQIGEAVGVSDLHPTIFYVEQDEGSVGSEAYPKPVAAKLRPNNNHAQYAFFWFTMACALIGVYFTRFVLPILKHAKA